MSQTYNVNEIVPGSTPPATDIVKIVDSMDALKTHFSGATPPATSVAGQHWLDTSLSPPVLKRRNAANNKWLSPYEAGPYTTSGTAIAFTISTDLDSQLYSGEKFRVKFNQASGAAPTLNRDGLGAKALKRYGNPATTGASGAKVDAVLAANQLVDVEYDGTDYVVCDLTVRPAFYTGGTATHTAGSNPIIFGSIGLDSTSAYNTTDGKYTPKVAGYYLFCVQAFFGAGDNVRFSVSIYKNGISEVVGFANGNTGGGGCIASASVVTYMNGTTDFVQAWSDYGAAGPNSSNDLTHFSGALIS